MQAHKHLWNKRSYNHIQKADICNQQQITEHNHKRICTRNPTAKGWHFTLIRGYVTEFQSYFQATPLRYGLQSANNPHSTVAWFWHSAFDHRQTF